MKTICLLTVFLPFFCISQVLNYSPNRKLDKTVDKMYYNTEFIFIENLTDTPLNLVFETLESTLLPEWSATICTNTQCYTTVPNSGSFGSIVGDKTAYISFNLAANEAIGEGQVRFAISSPNDSELHDTVTFRYNVTEDGKVKARPWANINYVQGVVHVLLENPELETALDIISINGKPLFSSTALDPISSYPLRDHPAGIYIIIIRDEKDRVITRKIPHS